MYESKILNVKIQQAKIHFIPDVVYSQVETLESPNKLLQMDILKPAVDKKLPCVIFVTGGGFISANRARMPQLRMKLAEENFFVASINYRTVPNSTFPAPVEDVKAAIRFLRANSEKFNIDSEKIFLVGDSAGGYLVTFSAVTNDSKLFNVGENLNYSSKIAAAVNLYGFVDIKSLTAFPQMLNSLTVPAEKTNPINYINKNSAPMLLMHGTADEIVSPEQTELLFQALKAQGVEVERYLIPNANHADEHWQQPETLEVIIKFLKAHLQNPIYGKM